MFRRAQFSYCSVFKVNMHNQKSTYSTCGVSSLQFELCFSRFLILFGCLPFPPCPLSRHVAWWTEQDVEPVGGCFIGFSCGWSDGMSVEADLKFKRSGADSWSFWCICTRHPVTQLWASWVSIPLAQLMVRDDCQTPSPGPKLLTPHTPFLLTNWILPGSSRKDAWVRGIGDIQRAWKCHAERLCHRGDVTSTCELLQNSFMVSLDHLAHWCRFLKPVDKTTNCRSKLPTSGIWKTITQNWLIPRYTYLINSAQ